REDSNIVVTVRLKGEQEQEVHLDWSSVILVVNKTVTPDKTKSDPYISSTGCVQSKAKEITRLAGNIWPKNGRVDDYAKNIQRFILGMKQAKQPRSLDALGILDSGASGICTANANLALALLRSKGIAARSIVVIPSISQRLEMHRIVECFDEGGWRSFDPSSLQTDMPMKPWQNIIVAKTTIADENLAMKPRMGSMVGCPYGQELELMDYGISLWGQDFFWTIARPVAEFEASDTAIGLATSNWNRYMEMGILSQGQIKAASAKNAEEFLEFLQTN
ncbi:MAG: hypothetical protein A2161_05835, partial [Candidatus Schekmanbacteria bacterium RBG_13_48_7]